MPDADAAKEAALYLEQCMKEKNSAGGMIECRITGLPAGLCLLYTSDAADEMRTV